MPHKSSIPPEDKIKAVEDYLAGRLGAREFERVYEKPNARLYEWVRWYKTRGGIGLFPASTNRKYPIEVKRLAVEEYLSGTMSLNDICVKYDISTRDMVIRWIKCYNNHENSEQSKHGGTNFMTKTRKTTFEERTEMVGYCLSNNKSYDKTAEKYGISYQQIYGWVRKFEADGIDGLADRRGKRKDGKSMSEVDKLRTQIKLKEAEVLRLQMENELLKKLEALERGQNIN